MQNKRLIIILLVALGILAIPQVAMQFSDEVNWSLTDFIIAGFLLLGTGLLCEFVLRRYRNLRYKYLIVVILILILLVIWAELAVGIFGSPFAGN